MPKKQNTMEKRRREMEKKRKAEEKRVQRKKKKDSVQDALTMKAETGDELITPSE